LFKSTTKLSQRSELLIFITPRINKKADATEDNS
jgi:type II secretory pathway component HofQ